MWPWLTAGRLTKHSRRLGATTSHTKHPLMDMTFKNICSKLKKHGLWVSGVMTKGPFHVFALQPEPPLWQKRIYLSLSSTIWNSATDFGPHFWSIMRQVRTLTFLTDSEMFSNMRSFTFSWSITGLLARLTQSADSLDLQALLFCYSKLTPPAQASWHANHG